HAATTGSTTQVDLLALAAAAETDSQPPLARAIVARAAATRRDEPRATDFRPLTSVGVEATVPTPDGPRRVAVGGPALLGERGLDPLPDADEWASDGETVLHVVVSPAGGPGDGGPDDDGQRGEVVGALALADAV